MHANATKPSSAIASVSGHIAAIWCEFVIANTATPLSFASLINSGKPTFKTIGANVWLPKTFITLEEIFLTSGLALPLTFLLFNAAT